MNETFVDGFAEIELETWKDYLDYTSSPFFDDAWIFRGHARKSWRLVTSLTRTARDLGIDPDTPLKDRHLRRFRDSVRGRLQLPEYLSRADEEVWAVGQHHGLATPLLDWTESPVVAAFFAFSDARSVVVPEGGDPPTREKLETWASEPRSILALNGAAIDRQYYELLIDRLRAQFGANLEPELRDSLSLVYATHGFDELGIAIHRIATGRLPSSPTARAHCRFVRDMVLTEFLQLVRPESGENARLVSQRGLFTFSWVMRSLENLVHQHFAGSSDAVLLKINLPNAIRPDTLTALSRMNVGWLSLFPDLQGSSQHCNAELSVGAAPLDWSRLGEA